MVFVAFLFCGLVYEYSSLARAFYNVAFCDFGLDFCDIFVWTF